MRAECATIDLARQGREDGLISTITQISSAALLAIPGFLFSLTDLPSFNRAPLVYIGIGTFLVSLLSAMLEQYLSGIAYRKQREIAINYYLLKDTKVLDGCFVKIVNLARNVSYISFIIAVVVTSGSLLLI